jgi:hypothetical protein
VTQEVPPVTQEVPPMTQEVPPVTEEVPRLCWLQARADPSASARVPSLQARQQQLDDLGLIPPEVAALHWRPGHVDPSWVHPSLVPTSASSTSTDKRPSASSEVLQCSIFAACGTQCMQLARNDSQALHLPERGCCPHCQGHFAGQALFPSVASSRAIIVHEIQQGASFCPVLIWRCLSAA